MSTLSSWTLLSIWGSKFYTASVSLASSIVTYPLLSKSSSINLGFLLLLEVSFFNRLVCSFYPSFLRSSFSLFLRMAFLRAVTFLFLAFSMIYLTISLFSFRSSTTIFLGFVFNLFEAVVSMTVPVPIGSFGWALTWSRWEWGFIIYWISFFTGLEALREDFTSSPGLFPSY